MLAPKPLGGLTRALILAVLVISVPAATAQPSPPPPSETAESQSQTTEPNGSVPKPSPPPGQKDSPQTPTNQMESAESNQSIDPKAMEALQQMGKYLASMKTLMFNARIFTEVVLDNKQKLLIGGKVMYMATPPDQLRVDLTTDSITRQFFHSDNKFTMLAPRNGYFAEIEASQPTPEVLTQAAKDYGIEIPFADLLEWGRKPDAWAGIKEGFLVNSPMVNGQRTKHWAFRSENLDWEIWIRVGDQPLPLRISTVNTRDPSKPRFLATLKWMEAKPGATGKYKPATEKLKKIPLKKAEPNKQMEGAQ
ncbi:DUF2092 domain-containing protein [Microbulbifer sp. VTAC004]|uniref:DUF2092 domain-containing protein n=1 Tax=unclassified Microbulbifer TaxID=2619833 RepID=UPI00403A2A5C